MTTDKIGPRPRRSNDEIRENARTVADKLMVCRVCGGKSSMLVPLCDTHTPPRASVLTVESTTPSDAEGNLLAAFKSRFGASGAHLAKAVLDAVHEVVDAAREQPAHVTPSATATSSAPTDYNREVRNIIDPARIVGGGDGFKGTNVTFGFEALYEAVTTALRARDATIAEAHALHLALRAEVAATHRRVAEHESTIQRMQGQVESDDAALEASSRENGELRRIMSKAVDAIGNRSFAEEWVSLEFLSNLPKESAGQVAKLRQERDTAEQRIANYLTKWLRGMGEMPGMPISLIALNLLSDGIQHGRAKGWTESPDAPRAT